MLAILLTACGTGARASTTGSTAPSSTVAADGASGPSGASGPGGGRFNLTPAQRAQLKAYSDCLTQHGVTIQLLARLASGQGFGGRPSGSTGPRGPSGASGQGGGFGGPNGGGPPTTIDQTAFKAADAACAAQRPTGIDIATLLSPRGGFGGNRGANSAAFRAYVSCLSDHGVKVTTPTTSANASPTTAAGSSSSSVPAPVPTFDRNDPAFAAANQVCSALLPNNGAPGGAGTTTTTTQA